MAVDVGQAALDAVVVVRQLFMVQAEQVQRCGVQVVAVGRMFGGQVAEIVGGSVADSAFDSSAGQPGGERSAVVVSTGSACSLGGRLASEFGRAHDECFVEQAASFQVVKECRRAGVENAAPLAVVARQVFV